MRDCATVAGDVTDFDVLDDDMLARAIGGYSPELFGAMQQAVQHGLTINSTWTGGHTSGSMHYEGRAFDASGTPNAMQAFYNWAAANTDASEVIHGSRFLKDGVRVGGIGGHDNHVHFSI